MPVGFRVNCAIRIVLLTGTIIVFSWLLTGPQYVSLGLCGLLILGQTYALLRYVEQTSRNVALLLQSIEVSDFSLRPSRTPRGSAFAELATTLDRIISRVGEVHLAREENLRYLHAVVRHIATGVLVFDGAGTVDLLNQAAKSLLGIRSLRSINDLEPVHPELLARLGSLGPGQRDLVTVTVNDELRQLSIHRNELRQSSKTLTIVAIQNISQELNEKEMEAWQNLIRVLTHEIKNSLTPIISLAASVKQLVLGNGETAARSPAGEKVREALQIIERRSQGLLGFVDAHRDLTHLPRPKLRACVVGELLTRVEQLIAPQLENPQVELGSVIHPPSMTVTADPELVEQALINLLLNAVQATAGQAAGRIMIEALIDERSRPLIRVTDNGPGIVADPITKVFVPFYSTKKEGTGIGLSLSRQIMRLHRGDLTVQSEPGVQTTFTLRF